MKRKKEREGAEENKTSLIIKRRGGVHAVIKQTVSVEDINLDALCDSVSITLFCVYTFVVGRCRMTALVVREMRKLYSFI